MSIVTTNLQQAIKDLRQGKPVAIPTETVYGLAALIENETGIREVFSMKNRPLNHPLIVHVAKDQDLSAWVEDIPNYAKDLMQAFWPGPLTLVFKAKAGRINPLITGGQSTVAIRSPNHPLTQDLLKAVDMPLVAPSANPFGKISPTTAAHVLHSFPDKPITVLNGGRCQVGIESTIIDATQAENYTILRHGSITEALLSAVAPGLVSQPDSDIRVPGKLASHYQPEKTLYYFTDHFELERFCSINPSQVFAITPDKPAAVTENAYLKFPDAPEKAAFELYYQLRQADKSDKAIIVIELPSDTDAWAGVKERIIKAGQPYKADETE